MKNEQIEFAKSVILPSLNLLKPAILFVYDLLFRLSDETRFNLDMVDDLRANV